ncbi:hypothetical protein ACH5Y9_04610 [Methylomonas sp. BW4-1]|uniref:5-bromo-4-chloroindolyl phosphate hydrolysis protein n=1 Tax=Methylomonas defluvii TaxID=3045149 RepID=A0ABU4UG81_9GAMM|nr:hypothetical protein [Methylomonas sp. OY6]MDX8128334.1 hypothetical protein [Methylomonas sp. OY6]
MFGRLFFGGLLIGSLAMLLFVLGFVCLQFGLVLLMGLFYLLASKVMLLALGLLALLSVLTLFKAVYRELRGYFSRESAALRQLVSLQIRRQNIERRQTAECRQLSYLSRFKRQRLLVADNRKQARALFAAISDELQAVRAQLPATRYKNLRKALRTYRKQADAAAMLALRQQLHVVD